jgi:hypothetical protein
VRRALVVGAVAALAAAAAPAGADAKKKDAEPTRPWFRAKVDFDGLIRVTLRHKDFPGPLVETYGMRWEGESSKAVLVKRRGSTVGTRAVTKGAVTDYTYDFRHPGIRRDSGYECPPWAHTGRLRTTPWPGIGSAGTNDGFLYVSFYPRPSNDVVTYPAVTRTCKAPNGVVATVTDPEIQGPCCPYLRVEDQRAFPETEYVMGTESVLGNIDIQKRLGFGVGRGTFGKDTIEVHETIVYGFTRQEGATQVTRRWRYTYTVQLEPCPDEGRDVEDC